VLALGLDPGVERTGWGLVEERGGVLHPVSWGLIRTPAAHPLSDRLLLLASEVDKVLDETKPDVAVVEKLYFKKNVTSAIAVAHARGVVLLALVRRGIELREYAPPEIKAAVTGYGSATKDQVAHMVMRLLALTSPVGQDDVADALAISLCGLIRRGA